MYRVLPHLSVCDSVCVCRDQRPATGGEGDSDYRTQAQGVLVKECSGTGAAGAAGAATGAAAGATAGAATNTIPGAAAGGTSASAGHVCSRRTRPPRPPPLGAATAAAEGRRIRRHGRCDGRWSDLFDTHILSQQHVLFVSINVGVLFIAPPRFASQVNGFDHNTTCMDAHSSLLLVIMNK